MSRPGLYRGIVVSDNRPAGKLLIQVPGALGKSIVEAISHQVLFGWDPTVSEVTYLEYGLDAGTGIWVMFEQGDVLHPVVTGLL